MLDAALSASPLRLGEARSADIQCEVISGIRNVGCDGGGVVSSPLAGISPPHIVVSAQTSEKSFRKTFARMWESLSPPRPPNPRYWGGAKMCISPLLRLLSSCLDT